ncbi:hypothetical protein MYU51_013561 [Penicillium brevicompactum]|uniref:uncharacterized protein n=1 Tax=Penicillium brevicompactum TaxID=5074 RepID=UPI0025412909|nr:uncharacterized protein N7506_011958 [Penicillium brevicompactum]KAJ5319254.1 hypothetical protein N7506_011958 [Penicillium brevicompactum]
MRLSFAGKAAFAVFVSSAAALQLPGLSSLLKREDIEPGSPLYNCHAACGEVILISEAGNYCSNSTFTTDLDSCLKCALTYNIWQYYGDSVKSAATSCSDDATPSSSSATSGAASAGAATATATTTGDTSTVTGSTSSSTPSGTTSSGAASAATATSASAASASASTNAASGTQQNVVFSMLMGAAAWALI